MTTTEASAVNTLLRHLTGLDDRLPSPTGTEVRAAAATLARGAYRRLAAGLRPADLDTIWPAQVLYAVTREHADRLAGRTLTDGEAEQISRALPHSSIPDALDTVIASIVTPD